MNRRFWFVAISLPLAFVGVFLIGWSGSATGIGSFTSAISDFIAVPIAFALAMAVFYVFNKVELPEEDFVEHMHEESILAFAIVLAAMLLFIAIIAHGAMAQAPCQANIAPPSDTFAHQRGQVAMEGICRIGTVETPPGSNEGEYVEKCLRSVDLGGGYPYCAACASMWLDQHVEGPIGRERPFAGKPIRSALSVHFAAARHWIEAKKVRRGHVSVPVGCIGVYRKGHSDHGHTVVVTGDEKKSGPWRGHCGTTVEANTKPGEKSERVRRDADDRGGIWGRVRCIQPNAYFRLIGFACPTS